MELSEAIEVISADAMEQYEEVRTSGYCNMIDRNCVSDACELMGHYDLVEIAEDRKLYAALLLNYSGLMQHYGIKQ